MAISFVCISHRVLTHTNGQERLEYNDCYGTHEKQQQKREMNVELHIGLHTQKRHQIKYKLLDSKIEGLFDLRHQQLTMNNELDISLPSSFGRNTS